MTPPTRARLAQQVRCLTATYTNAAASAHPATACAYDHVASECRHLLTDLEKQRPHREPTEYVRFSARSMAAMVYSLANANAGDTAAAHIYRGARIALLALIGEYAAPGGEEWA